MILVKELATHQKVFNSVRLAVQELHPQMSFSEDPGSMPLLFKSADDKVWVRIFFQPMDDLSASHMERELLKLKVLMPRDAILYLFYPGLDRERIVFLQSAAQGLVFFEYDPAEAVDAQGAGIRIRKWIPEGIELDRGPAAVEPPAVKVLDRPMARFLSYTQLSQPEIEGLIDLGLSLPNS